MLGKYTAVTPQNAQAASRAALMALYEPPVSPQSNNITTGSAVVENLPAADETLHDGSTVVSRKWRLKGMRYLYSRGSRRIRQFTMTATGQVPSSEYQRITAWTWDAAFNDNLYRSGGYPRNLGLSEKVGTIPPEALGTSPYQMLPRPRYTRSIFTNRSYSGAPIVPAQPINPTRGQHS